MSKVWILTRVQLSGLWTKKALTPLMKFGIGAIGLVLLGLMFLYSFAIGYSLQMMSSLRLLPGLMVALSSLLTLVTTIYKVNGILFAFRDYDMVMSLPVTTQAVVASRILLLYLFDLAFTLMVMIPAGTAYAFLAVPPAGFYALFLLSLPFIPMIPLILAVAVGSIITAIASRFRHSGFVNVVFSAAAVIAIYFLSFSVSSGNANLGNLSLVLTEMLEKIYPPVYLFMEGVCDLHLMPLLGFLLLSAVLFVFFCFVLGFRFQQINSALIGKAAKGNYKMERLKSVSPETALFRKEAQRFFSTPLYLMNMGMGAILLLVLSIALLFVAPDQLDALLLEVPNLKEVIGCLAPLAASFFVVISCTSACSLSLEGKNIWILKSAPVRPIAILNSKILLNLSVTLPVVLVSSVLLAIGLRLGFSGGILLFLVASAYALFISVTGLAINLKWPNLNWTSEAEVIKQGMATTVTIFVGLGVIVLPFTVFLPLLSLPKELLLGTLTVVLLLTSLLVYRFIRRKGIRILEEL